MRKNSSGRTEPKGVTLADLFVLVFGCAIAFALLKSGTTEISVMGWSISEPPEPPRWTGWYREAEVFALLLDLVLALFTLGRCLRWNRVPRPSEWLAIVPALWFFVWIDLRLCRSSSVFFLSCDWLFRNGPFAPLSQRWFLGASDIARGIVGILITEWAIPLAFVIPIGWLATLRFGPSWNRWLGLDYDRSNAIPLPSEA